MACYVVFHQAQLSSNKFNVNQATESLSKRVKWRLAPTRREQDKWNRAAKAATDGSVSNFNISHNKFVSFVSDFLLTEYISQLVKVYKLGMRRT